MDAETSRQIAELRAEIADARAKMAGLLGRAGGYVAGQIDLNGWLQLWKQSSVGTPGTDKVRITVVDKAGDESVVAIFDDGSTVELANQGSGIGPHAMAIHTDEDTWHAGLTGASLHNPKAHALASSYHTASGLTEGYTIRATGATTFAWQQLQHNDLGGVTANQHHSQQHAMVGSDHTASGLTAGHVIRATGATTFAWQQLQHGDLGGIGASDHHDPVTAGDGIAVTGQQVAVDLASPSGLSFAAGKLQLDNSIAGAGLAIASKVLSVNVGNGLAISGDVVLHDIGDLGDLHWNYAETGYTEIITGAWTFQGTLTARDILPDWTDAYDIGSSTKLWRKGWFSELDSILFAQQTITLIGGWFSLVKYASTVNEDVSDSDTETDFGTDSVPPNMNANDFVIFRRFGAVEYMQLVSHSGSGVWTVTRNVDGSGANTWAKGSPFANYGYNGTGRIDLDAQTGGPRFSILQQGTSYNAFTERVRLGDLNGWGPFSSTVYGWAVGSYSGNEFAYYAPTTGLKVRGTITADDGTLVNLSVTGTLTLSGSGKLITAASPNPRIEQTTTLLAGYSDATTKQFYLQASDGKAYAGGGHIVLDVDGITFPYAGGMFYNASDAIKFEIAGGLRGTIYLLSGIDNDYSTLVLHPQNGVKDAVNVIADEFTLLIGPGGAPMGEFTASDTTWLRINQTIAKNIYTPRSFAIGSTLTVGTSTFGNAGDVGYTANLRPIRGGTWYTGRVIIANKWVAPSADYTITTSWADVTGFTQTLTIPTGGGQLFVVVHACFEMSSYAAVNNVFYRLMVGGEQKDVTITKSGNFTWDIQEASLTWTGAVAAGSCEVKVQATKSDSNNTIYAIAAQSSMAILSFV